MFNGWVTDLAFFLFQSFALCVVTMPRGCGHVLCFGGIGSFLPGGSWAVDARTRLDALPLANHCGDRSFNARHGVLAGAPRVLCDPWYGGWLARLCNCVTCVQVLPN